MRAIFCFAAMMLGAHAAAAPAPSVRPSAPPHLLRVADPTSDDKGAPNNDPAPPGASATDSNSDGRLQVRPPPEGPPKPPDLTVPPAPVTPPPPATEPGRNINQPDEPPPPAAWEGDEPPRGEGAAAIPRESPPAIAAFKRWLRSWFE